MELEKIENGGYATRKPNKVGVVSFEVLTEARLDELAVRGEPLPIVGELEVGRVLVMNQWGASWCMDVDEFDECFKSVEV